MDSHNSHNCLCRGVYGDLSDLPLPADARFSVLSGRGKSLVRASEKCPEKENPLRGLLGAFSFLARLKLVRSLAGASIPAKLVMAGNPITIVEFVILKVLSMAMFFALGTVFLKDIPRL